MFLEVGCPHLLQNENAVTLQLQFNSIIRKPMANIEKCEKMESTMFYFNSCDLFESPVHAICGNIVKPEKYNPEFHAIHYKKKYIEDPKKMLKNTREIQLKTSKDFL
ncbi:hypothetical protein HHI36_007681 [Cryptolaemus montrouzieri]|uniref:Uncharacterized protein n=1 Tax=Cryptolaemus montrouzieri TaxID=559131 RepID=A0ABD2MQF7_9CUCU